MANTVAMGDSDVAVLRVADGAIVGGYAGTDVGFAPDVSELFAVVTDAGSLVTLTLQSGTLGVAESRPLPAAGPNDRSR